MKILQSIPYFNPKFGGDVNVCANLARQLAMRHHEVTIITTDFNFDSQYADNIRKVGVNVIPLPCAARIGIFLYSPQIKTWLEKNLKEFELIHLHNFRSYQNKEIHSFAMKYGVPYIVQAHGSVLPFFEKQKLKKLYDFVWGNRILRDASKLIALTETESEQYQRMGVPKNKIEIIPNGIDLAEFESLPAFGKFRKQYGIQENCNIILFVGRIHKSKGLDILIDAFFDVSKDKIDSQLIIIGPDDGYLQQLKEKIEKLHLQKKIQVIGFISQKEKIQAFTDADVFITPSYAGFPITFLEACACGLPIITSIHGDSLTWINDNVGIVVDYDHNSLKNAIIQILTNKDLKTKFGENGKNLIKREFNWTVIIHSLEKTYLQSIKENVENI